MTPDITAPSSVEMIITLYIHIFTRGHQVNLSFQHAFKYFVLAPPSLLHTTFKIFFAWLQVQRHFCYLLIADSILPL